MPKKKTGEALHWVQTKQSWSGRVRGYPEGSPRGLWLSLGTNDKALAAERYARWLETGVPPKDAAPETFEQAALRVVGALPDQTPTQKKKKHDRGTRLRSYVLPFLGHVLAHEVRPAHVARVLDRMPALGKLKGTIAYVRTDVSQVFEQLIREDVRTDNPADGLRLPKAAVEDGRLRTVPTDEEFLRFREKRGFETELDIACFLCRDTAGQRTSDLLEARWDHFDFARGTVRVRRPKTDTEGKLVTTRRAKSYELVEHVLDESVARVLEAYWKRQGAPKAGPLFTVQHSTKQATVRRKDGSTYERQANHLGGAKRRQGASFGPALRRAFWQAGIYRPLPGFDPAAPDRKLCRFQTDTETSRRLDFHSLRRAFVTALKHAQTPLADVLALAGHTQLATSSRYDTARQVRMPEGALPGNGQRREPPPPAPPVARENPDLGTVLAQLDALKAALSGHPSLSESVPKGGNGLDSRSYWSFKSPLITANSLESLVEPRGIEPLTYALRTDCEPVSPPQLLGKTEAVQALPTPENPLSVSALGRSIQDAAAAGDWALVEELTAIARRRAAGIIASVHNLADARKRRG